MNIKPGTFEGVTNVEEIVLTGKGEIPNYVNRYDDHSTYYTPWYQSRNNIKIVEIEEGITSIGDYAFFECSGLTSIVIPNSVTSIGSNAFGRCTGLTSIEIPNSVISIKGAFSQCTSLKKITVPGTKHFDWQSGYDLGEVYNLEEIVLTGEGVIPDYYYSSSMYDYKTTPWYRSRNNIKSIEIKEGITRIGKYAFYNCSGITKLTMPVTAEIRETAFGGLVNLEEVILTGKGSSQNYNDNSYRYTPWYQSRNNIKIVEIEEGITSIGNYTFYGCSSLTNINIPESVTSIGNYAFYGCIGITSIEIPSSVTNIGIAAFSGWKSNQTIYIEAESKPDGWNSYWNSGCSANIVWGYTGE